MICWSAPVKDGFKMLRVGDVAILAHRLAWELEFGPIPDGMLVLHRCWNPACVNVGHLYLGTEEAKNAAMVASGRHRTTRGEERWNAKLTDQTAMAIFKSTEAYDDLADDFSVSDTLVYAVKHKLVWKHVHAGSGDTTT